LQDQDFWKNKEEAENVIKEMGENQNLLDTYSDAVNSLEKLFQNLEKINDDEYYHIERIVREFETKRLFTGRWDKGNVIISIYAGAGGQDAADWVHMLYLMYEKYAQKKGWKVIVIDSAEELGEARTGRTSLKNITFEIKGSYAFGYLKKESGVHRLVRVSPFSAQSLRHTSFSLVEALPEIRERSLEIRPDDLRIEFFRSSGPGGQNVNKVETAVRIVHVPTGLVASAQVERSQSQNRDKAMAILEAKLVQLMEKERVQELDKLRTKVKPEWGSQIRSYVLNPYKLVKDHRTEYETTQVDKVIEGGDLDGFIEAELTQK
jgi:peptide chain release factor 2